MLTYNMDVEERSVWLRATPNNAVLAQPFYATEAGLFYGRSHFATARTDKESYILFYTLAGAGLIEQNEQHIELPQGAALLMNCRTPQSYCTAPGYDVWEHYWVHLDGVGVKTLADSVQSQGRLTAAHVSRMEMQPLFETLFAEWKKETTTAQIEIGLTLHKMLALLAHQQLSGDESRSNRTMIISVHIMRSPSIWICCWHRSLSAKAGFCGFSGNIWAQHRTIFCYPPVLPAQKNCWF